MQCNAKPCSLQAHFTRRTPSDAGIRTRTEAACNLSASFPLTSKGMPALKAKDQRQRTGVVPVEDRCFLVTFSDEPDYLIILVFHSPDRETRDGAVRMDQAGLASEKIDRQVGYFIGASRIVAEGMALSFKDRDRQIVFFSKFFCEPKGNDLVLFPVHHCDHSISVV